MAEMNRQCRLKSRPAAGMAARDNFEETTEPVGTPGEGEFLVKVDYISIDPAMRGWISEGRSYIDPVPLGAVMRAGAIGTVTVSNNPKFPVGAAVVGQFGVQDWCVSDGKGCYVVDTTQAPPQRWVGGLGMPGLTAYFGTTQILKPQAGETLVVSAASGAVGSVVGQIGKNAGAKVIGIAGGKAKCDYVVKDLGFDACIDYKAENVAKRLRELAPDRIDMYFENVGGPIGNAVFHHMNYFGRVAVCGLIAGYNATSPEGLGYDPGAQRSILVNRLTVRGFIVFDFARQYGEGLRAMGQWHAEGKIKLREDVREGGAHAFPDVLNELYTGGNFGKLVLKM